MAPEGLVGRLAIRVYPRHAELLHLKLADELVVEHVAKRSVSKVVTEASNRDVSDLGSRDLELGLVLGQQLHLLARQVTSPDAMLCTLVRAAREHLVAKPELLQPLQSFELWCVDNVPVDRLQREYAVNRIVDLAIQLTLGQLDIADELL